MLLNIPFISQRHNAVRNDCGAAVIASIANQTVDQILDDIGAENHKPLTFHQIYTGLKAHGLPFKYRNDLTINAIINYLNQGNPTIMLLSYKRLPRELKAINFNGSHWCLAVGYDDKHIFVHDPLRTQDEGGYQPWTKTALQLAISDTGTTNLPRQGLIILKRFSFLQNKPEKNSDVLKHISNTTTALIEEVKELNQLVDSLTQYLTELYDILGVSSPIGPKAQAEAIKTIKNQ